MVVNPLISREQILQRASFDLQECTSLLHCAEEDQKSLSQSGKEQTTMRTKHKGARGGVNPKTEKMDETLQNSEEKMDETLEEESLEEKDKQNKSKRIMVSGCDDLDQGIVSQHELYKWTGSIEAQARIDSYIIPCIIMRTLGRPYEGEPNTQPGALRNHIPQYLWDCMVRPTDLEDVLQYGNLPDLGSYIHNRVLCQSVFVTTCPSCHFQTSQEDYANQTVGLFSGARKKNKQTKRRKTMKEKKEDEEKEDEDEEKECNEYDDDDDSDEMDVPQADRRQSGAKTHKITINSVLAASHMCCPSPYSTMTPQQTAQWHTPQVDSPVALPQSCTPAGCLHGSILSVLIGSVMPICKKLLQCRKLQSTHPHVRSAVSCCTLMEFAVICSLLQALLLGLYPRGRKTAVFDVRIELVSRIRR